MKEEMECEDHYDEDESKDINDSEGEGFTKSMKAVVPKRLPDIKKENPKECTI